jgi:hypothetical protein
MQMKGVYSLAHADAVSRELQYAEQQHLSTSKAVYRGLYEAADAALLTGVALAMVRLLHVAASLQ